MSQSSKSDSNTQDYSDSQLIINSLEQTIQQLQKALTKINQTDNNDKLPNLSIVEKLVDSSNQLVNSLEENSSADKQTDSLKMNNPPQNQKIVVNNNDDWGDLIVEESTNTQPKYKTNQQQQQKRQRKNNQIIKIIIIALVISVIIFVSWWFYNSDILREKNNQLINQIQSALKAKPQEVLLDKQNPINQNLPTESPEIKPSIDLNPNLEIDKNEEENTPTPEKEIENLTNQNENIINQSEKQASDKITPINQPEVLPEKYPLLAEEKELLNQELDNQPIKEENNQIESNLTSEITSLSLTPEQSLIQGIENQVVEITQKYGENLIVGITANFGKNYLLVTLDSEWYDLSNNQQDNLINAIFTEAKTIDFNKLQVEDTNHNLVARSAVIGNKVIIINR